jgi:hypothetical protein
MPTRVTEIPAVEEADIPVPVGIPMPFDAIPTTTMNAKPTTPVDLPLEGLEEEIAIPAAGKAIRIPSQKQAAKPAKKTFSGALGPVKAPVPATMKNRGERPPQEKADHDDDSVDLDVVNCQEV